MKTMPAQDAYPALIGDIGGTNARFGLVPEKRSAPLEIRTLANASYPSLVAALGHYLGLVGGARPRRACIAVAGPVEIGRFHLTNRPQWDTDLASVAKAHGLSVLTVLNDFEALAESVPLLGEQELVPVGGERAADAVAPKAVLGPGTGLGIGVAVRTAVGWMAVPGEGGHMELASTDPLGTAAIAHERKIRGRASAERFLSGPGIERLHLALGEVQDRPREPVTAAVLSERAFAGDADARQTVRMFFTLLAGLAGDVALLFGARGGVFLGGGVTERLANLLDHRAFREAFENKGRLKPYLAAIPVHLIAAEMPALRGCAAHLERLGAAPPEGV
ncbi:MAG: ROK family protein [Pseudomonadota bacterium]|nr:ROK family protein [Pseudomonadota bacterium]